MLKKKILHILLLIFSLAQLLMAADFAPSRFETEVVYINAHNPITNNIYSNHLLIIRLWEIIVCGC